MRLIYVTNGFPYPLTSGYLRHYHLLRGLAARHDVTLLALAGRDHTPEDRAAVEALGVAVRTFPRGKRSPLELLAPGVARGGVRLLCDAVAEQVRSGAADAAVFSGKRTYPALSAFGRVPVLVDVCDATSQRLKGELRAELGERGFRWRAPVTAADLASVRWVERQLRRRALHATFASDRDRDALGWPASSATVVPNGVDASYWRRSRPALGRDRIVFTGKLDYPPNEDAALFLAGEVLPRVHATLPQVELVLVGRNPTERVRALASHPRVTVTGEVPDVRPHLEEASVFAAPLRFGAGIQNKILEALAMEVPVVASELAAGGLEIGGAAPPVRRAEGADASAAALVVELLRVGRDPAPHEAGRRFVVEHFDWERSSELMDEALERTVALRRVH